MTFEELNEIKLDIKNNVSSTDIAMNRGLNKASMIAILNFEPIISSHLKKSIVGDFEEEIKILEDEIKILKSFNKDEKIVSLNNDLNILEDENNDLNKELVLLNRKIFKYENSFFSF